MLLLAVFASRFTLAAGFCEVDDPGTAAFIRNEYVEFGIGAEGAFGEEGYPSSWHYRSNTGQLGFVANPQADGWTNYYGDFFSPGSPLEGWGVEFDGVAYDNTNGWTSSVSGSLGDPACEVDICGNLGGAVTWTGTVGDLGVETQYGVVNDEVYVVMTVTLTNSGTSTLTDVHWFRNLDPDNSVMTAGDYATTNTIVSQPDSSTDLASVHATGADGADLYLLASDSRARASHGGFYNADASDIWSGVDLYSAVGDSAYDDAAISLAVRLGDMDPGQSETFRVVYTLDESAVAAATDCAEAPTEPDDDGDGVEDSTDTCPSDPLNDADGDGVCGDVDVCEGSADSEDYDLDGAPDGCDECPFDAMGDTDADGSCDTDDICPGADDALDADGDAVPNGCDTCPEDAADDSDGDGTCDSGDACPGFDDAADLDEDGLADDCDACPSDPLNDSDDDGACDDADPCPSDPLDDWDSDGLCESEDACPLDADNDADGDGSCGDSDVCPSDPLNDADGDGVCGSTDNCPADYNLTQQDEDSDGVGDVCDPTDDRPTDTGHADTGGDDTADTAAADTAQDEDTSGETGPNCPEDEDEEQTFRGGWSCSTTGGGDPLSVVLMAALLLAIGARRAPSR